MNRTKQLYLVLGSFSLTFSSCATYPYGSASYKEYLGKEMDRHDERIQKCADYLPYPKTIGKETTTVTVAIDIDEAGKAMPAVTVEPAHERTRKCFADTIGAIPFAPPQGRMIGGMASYTYRYSRSLQPVGDFSHEE